MCLDKGNLTYLLAYYFISFVRLYSDFKASKNEVTHGSVDNLPSYGVSFMHNGHLSLSANSSIILVQALLRLLVHLTKINKSLTRKVCRIKENCYYDTVNLLYIPVYSFWVRSGSGLYAYIRYLMEFALF